MSLSDESTATVSPREPASFKAFEDLAEAATSALSVFFLGEEETVPLPLADEVFARTDEDPALAPAGCEEDSPGESELLKRELLEQPARRKMENKICNKC
ncbi:MAG: hypothetical protein KGJ59_13085 [Bacteroidota bacterium]|nr:hypothetical protein [Bacteroidota bacterium]